MASRPTRVLRTLLCALVCLAPWARAEDPEDYVFEQIRLLTEKRIEGLGKEGALNGDEARKSFLLEWARTRERLKTIRAVKSEGLSFSGAYEKYLSERVLPAYESVAKKAGVEYDAAPYEAWLQSENARFGEAVESYRSRGDLVRGSHPEVDRVISLLSFSRSETLGEGKIGDWNPASPEDIQSSAIHGLLKAIHESHRLGREGAPLKLDTLRKLQAEMLGKAAHFYSQPGRINDIWFHRADGTKKHVKEYLAEWEKDVNRPGTSARDAFEAYRTFLHLHPFGDSNGRIAELAKQYLLARDGLSPVITPEKTALENYWAQPVFGESHVESEGADALEESKSYMENWEKLLGAGWEIRSVNLSGPNIVVETYRGGENRLVVTNRSYAMKPGDALPPIRGSVVVSGGGPESAEMRLTHDRWKSFGDYKATAATPARRLGQLRVSYPFYEVPLPGHEGHLPLSFVFHYKHPNGEEVWFNNEGANYNVRLSAPAPDEKERAEARAKRESEEHPPSLFSAAPGCEVIHEL